MTFTVGGQTQRSAKFEFAASFFGPDYSGISFTFFPFPISDYEPGHVLMYVNADEVVITSYSIHYTKLYDWPRGSSTPGPTA